MSLLSSADFDGPCDLCLPAAAAGTEAEDGSLRARVLRALSLGYRTVAVEVRVSQEDLVTKASAKKAKRARVEEQQSSSSPMTDFPAPPKIDLSAEELKEFTRGDRRPRILTRLTIRFKDNNFLPVFNRSETATGYDLLALVPPSAQAMQALLKTGFRADLVCFEPETCRDVRWTRKLYYECAGGFARKRGAGGAGGAGAGAGGMHFEVCYSPAIRDAADRRRIISQAHTYHSVGRSRAVVLSSGARSPVELRSPADVSNLAFLLGLSEEQGRLAVGGAALDAVANALGRRLGPFRAKIEKITDMDAKDRWKVPGDKVEDDEDEASSSSDSSSFEKDVTEGDKDIIPI